MLSTYLFLFRAVLFEILLLEVLETPGAGASRTPWLILCGYGAVSTALLLAARARRLPDLANLASFLVDIVVSAAVMSCLPGAPVHFYVAYFLVILATCFLQKLLYSFLVGGIACVVYAGLAFESRDWAADSATLLRLSLLLCTALFTAFISDRIRSHEKAQEDQRQSRMAWMERLSLVGKAMSGVIHELKSPMATIVLGAEYVRELISRPGPYPEALAQLDVIKDEAERAGAILADFLNFAKPADLELKPLVVQVPLRKALERLAVRMEDAGVRLEAQLEESTVIAGSEPHLIQVFMNVLGNAIEAMPLSAGTLTVTERRLPDRVEIVVRDTGVGIEPERLARLFEPFETSKGGSGGHGIGLSVARWIVQKHGGDIRLSSEGLRRGTEAVLTFPIHRLT